MNCGYCERPAQYEVQAGFQRLRLCLECARAWTRRELNTPLLTWLQQMKPAPRSHTECPFCGCALATARETGLYGCPLCYLLLDA
ncbi:MAG: hypothetical protein N2554_06735 [Fimbriimonadales bacterium]|nr:hypothetical protein [Fimbriimonadales bacterium]